MKKNILVFFLIISLSACGNGGTSTNDKTENISTANSSTGNESCIKEYMTKYDQLLPLEIIKKHYDIPAQAKKKYVSGVMGKKYDKDTYEYTWESGRSRKMKMMGQEMDVPTPNRIGLRWLGSDLFMITGKATPLESFKAFYRNASAAEKEAAFKKAGEVLKEKGYDAKTTETATSMGKELSTDDIIFKAVSGIGEAASWRIKEKELTVLVRKITFQVVVDISTNDEENLSIAKKLAQEILNKCK